MIYYIIYAVIGYLIGSVPIGYILVKLEKGIDIRTVGSGNIGATNVGRILGLSGGMLCFLLDTAKGFIPTCYIFGSLKYLILSYNHWENGVPSFLWKVGVRPPDGFGISIAPELIIGLCVIIGHLFPVYIRFRGGKGVATALGVFLALTTIPTLVALIIWIVFFLPLGYVSLASIMASISLPLAHLWYFTYYMLAYDFNGSMWREYGLPIFTLSIIVSLLVIIKHIPNIKRLIKGTEPKVRLWRTKEQKN